MNKIYETFGFHWIKTDSTDLSQLNPATPAGHPDRKFWESPDPELRPVGLLLSTVHRLGATLDTDNFTIHQWGEVPTPFMNIPYNHVRKVLQSLVVVARSRAAEGQRQFNVGHAETDVEAYRMAISKVPFQHKKIVSYLSAGGALSKDKLFDMGLATTKK